METSKLVSIDMSKYYSDSDTFTEGQIINYGNLEMHDSVWTILFYPCGDNTDENKDKCMIQLKPEKKSTDAIVRFRFECCETNAADTFISSIKKPQSFSLFSTKQQPNVRENVLDVQIDVKILRLNQNGSIKDVSAVNCMNMKPTIKCCFKDENWTNQYKLQYDFDKCKYGFENYMHVPKFQSPIQDEMWCIQYYHGRFQSVFKLILCELPPNVSKLRVCCSICGDNHAINFVDVFDYDKYYACHEWSYLGLLSGMSKSIETKIEILNAYDMNGVD
eukprot:484284_1